MRVEGKRERSPVLIEEDKAGVCGVPEGFRNAGTLKSKESAWRQRDVKTLHYTASDIKLD